MLIASNVSFTVAAIALASLCFTAATAPGCAPAEHPSAEQVATEAREKLGQLVTALERVRQTAEAVADLAAAVTAARVAYDASDYREVLKQARAAVDAATRAGVEVPAEVGLRMAEAELLVGLVDG